MAKSYSNNSNDQINKIVENTVITGDIQSENNIRVDGKIVGSLMVKGKLVLGQNGVIEGEIVCQNAEIEGTIKGNLKVDNLLALKATCVINGDVTSPKISQEAGAIHNGFTSMSKPEKKIEAKIEILANGN